MTDTAPLTDEQLAGIRQRLAAASEGPWRVEDDPKDLHRWVVSDASPTLEIDFGYVGNRSQDEAEFVAHTRQDVPALLAEVGRLRAELAQEQQVSQDRGRYLAEVDAALIAAGEDEGGGYIAYARRIAQLAADRDEARDRAAAHEHSENLLASVLRDGRRLLAEATSPEQAVTDLHTLLNP